MRQRRISKGLLRCKDWTGDTKIYIAAIVGTKVSR